MALPPAANCAVMSIGEHVIFLLSSARQPAGMAVGSAPGLGHNWIEEVKPRRHVRTNSRGAYMIWEIMENSEDRSSKDCDVCQKIVEEWQVDFRWLPGNVAKASTTTMAKVETH